MPLTIHLVRHAQGFHNLSFDNHGMRDPLLTDLGKEQCAQLSRDFPHHSKLTAVVASPLKRTIYTALESFPGPISEKKLKVIALADIQEASGMPCDTGSPIAELEREFAGQPVDLELLSHVGDSWFDKQKGPYFPEPNNLDARARKARQWIKATFGEQQDGHVAVVTHGGFLHYFTEDWADHDKFPGMFLLSCEVTCEGRDGAVIIG